MEGTLLKWTNYFNGWQPRYFILEDGILSYYYSQDDINNSCKGSIKIAACDINAHNTDPTRLDIIIPGEAHYYLKAATAHDRQMWLVVLGSCKACNNNASFLLDNQSKNEAESSVNDMIKLKKSELLTYYDILSQHTYNIKQATKNKLNPDYQMLNESTTMIGETCECFINCLDECLRLVESKQLSSSSSSSFPSSFHNKVSDSPSSLKNSAWGTQPQARLSSSMERKSLSRGTSREKELFMPISNIAHLQDNCFQGNLSNSNNNVAIVDALWKKVSTSSQHSPSADDLHKNPPPQLKQHNTVTMTTTIENISNVPYNTSSICLTPRSDDKDDDKVRDDDDDDCHHGCHGDVRSPTFFSRLSLSFVDIKLTDELGIPTVRFLDACRSFVNIFDKLNTPAFTPARLDISANIKKLHQKYVTSPEKCATIQQMVLYELSASQSKDANSATQAILWLTKSFEFVKKLIEELISRPDEDDIQMIISDVYRDVLMHYHGWVLRSAFSIASSSSPSKKEIIRRLCVDQTDCDKKTFFHSLIKDAEDYVSGLKTILNLLNLFFDSQNLHIAIDEPL